MLFDEIKFHNCPHIIQMNIEMSISEPPSSLPNLMAENDVMHNSNDSPTNEPKEGVEKSCANIQPSKVLKYNHVSATDKIGTKTINHIKTQEITENSNSPSRIPIGIGVTKCPICGKQFGKSSLRFHQPQCEKKQAALQEKHEQAKLEEKRTSSYIIYEDFDAGKHDFLVIHLDIHTIIIIYGNFFKYVFSNYYHTSIHIFHIPRTYNHTLEYFSKTNNRGYPCGVNTNIIVSYV